MPWQNLPQTSQRGSMCMLVLMIHSHYKQHKSKSIRSTEEWEVGLSWKQHISVYQISMKPRGCRVCTLFTVLMRGKHLKPHSFMCLNCFHQQSWSLCSYYWPTESNKSTEVRIENNKNTSTANRRITFHRGHIVRNQSLEHLL